MYVSNKAKILDSPANGVCRQKGITRLGGYYLLHCWLHGIDLQPATAGTITLPHFTALLLIMQLNETCVQSLIITRPDDFGSSLVSGRLIRVSVNCVTTDMTGIRRVAFLVRCSDMCRSQTWVHWTARNKYCTRYVSWFHRTVFRHRHKLYNYKFCNTIQILEYTVSHFCITKERFIFAL